MNKQRQDQEKQQEQGKQSQAGEIKTKLKTGHAVWRLR
jgi:hypothetical protein